MKDFFQLREEMEQLDEKTKLARIALVGAIVAGIVATGHGGLVKVAQVRDYEQTGNALTVPQRKKVDSMH